MKHLWIVITCILSGCVASDSPSARIAREPQFSSWSPKAQGQIKAGQIDLGFTPEMVLTAWGEPAQRSADSHRSSRRDVWLYSEPREVMAPVQDSTGLFNFPILGWTLYAKSTVDIPTARVEFRSGRVVSFEQGPTLSKLSHRTPPKLPRSSVESARPF